MERRRTLTLVAVAAASAALLSNCSSTAPAPSAAPNAATGTEQPTEGSILVSSVPAAGSTVQGPVNELMLHFNPPARLTDVTVSGPDGVMPAKVTAVGEVAHYSIPLSGLGPGNYTVNWRATSGGREHQGSFAFTVR